MKFEPGFLLELKDSLARVKPEIRARLHRQGCLTAERLLSLVSSSGESSADDVDHPLQSDIVRYDDLVTATVGLDAIRSGQVAFIVLAGDDKAFMRLPGLGITLVANKLLQSLSNVPTWFMAAPRDMERFSRQFVGLASSTPVTVFEQFESYGLLVNNELDVIAPGEPSLHVTGTGDLGPALVESGVLDSNPNVKHCVIVDCGNALASLDPVIIGHHVESQKQVTCEIVERKSLDKRAVLAWVDNRLQLTSASRLHDAFLSVARYSSTGSMILNVEALRTEVPWRWHRVRKQSEGRLIVRYERFVEQYTEHLDSGYVLVGRDQRFLPVETDDDLIAASDVLDGNQHG